MFRSLLVIIIGGIVIWLIIRLSLMMKDALPGAPRKRSSPLKEGRIIDAEFEDITKEEEQERK